MGNLTDWIASNMVLAGGTGAFLCGAAIFYLVMARTLKRREQAEDT